MTYCNTCIGPISAPFTHILLSPASLYKTTNFIVLLFIHGLVLFAQTNLDRIGHPEYQAHWDRNGREICIACTIETEARKWVIWYGVYWE